MAFNQLNRIVTPNGIAVYPHLRSTEVFEGNDTGKYTCGIKLSKEDTDKIIENRQKRTIKEIFATEGEGYFRKLELELQLCHRYF